MWMAEVGNNIRKCIKDAGLKQKVVAERAGIDPGQLSRIINGHENDMMVSTLNGIIKAIGCSSDDILGKDEMTLKRAFDVINKYKEETERKQ